MKILDLHTHTISSGHAYSSLEENINGAVESNLQVFGMSDHASTMPGAPHPFHFLNLRVIPKYVKGVRILKGIEANIIDFKGTIDVSEELQNSLDYIIASLHPPVLIPGEMDQNTNTLLQVMENPNVKIIGHPDDGRYPLDYEAVVKKAKETQTLIEINNASLNPQGSRVNAEENYLKILAFCKQYEVPVIFGSDAHISFDVGNFSRCETLVKKADFPQSLIINSDLKKFHQYTKIKE